MEIRKYELDWGIARVATPYALPFFEMKKQFLVCFCYISNRIFDLLFLLHTFHSKIKAVL